jgi:hypothetical protein
MSLKRKLSCIEINDNSPRKKDSCKRICIHEDCNKQPVFNYPSEKRAIYCKTHKLENMIDVMHKKCIHCNKIPYYNYPSEKRGLYCKTHKLENMVNVISKKCIHCNKQPVFNYSSEKRGLYCNDHKL